MDQTSFSLLVGLLVGSHVGAFGLRHLTGWSLWVTYPTGGLVGLILFTAATYVLVEFIGRLFDRSRTKPTRDPNGRWDGLNKFLAFADLTKLSPVQRVAYLAYWYSSHIEMAGHHDYFSPPKYDYPEVVSALQAIGAIEQATVLTSALDAVQAASARGPEEYSNRFAAGVEVADLTELDETFERCTRSVPDCLIDYVEQHESEFVEWRP